MYDRKETRMRDVTDDEEMWSHERIPNIKIDDMVYFLFSLSFFHFRNISLYST